MASTMTGVARGTLQAIDMDSDNQHSLHNNKRKAVEENYTAAHPYDSFAPSVRSTSYSEQWQAYLSGSAAAASNNNDNDNTMDKEQTRKSTAPIHTKNVVIFDMAWWQDEVQVESWLVGCTNVGTVVVWNTSFLSRVGNDDNDEEFKNHSKGCEETSETRRRSASSRSSSSNRKPIWTRQVSKGVLYSIQIVKQPQEEEREPGTTTAGGTTVLAVSGEEGVFLLDWQLDFVDPIRRQREYCHNLNDAAGNENNNENKNNPNDLETFTTRRTLVPPHCHLKTFPSPFETSIEVNDIAIALAPAGASRGHYIFGAAGDAFGCYKWETMIPLPSLSKQQPSQQPPNDGRPVTTYNTNHHRQSTALRSGGFPPTASLYLHTCCLVPNPTIRNNNNSKNINTTNQQWLLTGGEAGILQVWDISKDQLVDEIRVCDVVAEHLGQSTSTSRLLQEQQPHRHHQQQQHQQQPQHQQHSGSGSGSDTTCSKKSASGVTTTTTTDPRTKKVVATNTLTVVTTATTPTGKDAGHEKQSTFSSSSSSCTLSPCWISCCTSLNETWWIVAGGISPQQQQQQQHENSAAVVVGRGFVTCWHAPTRSLQAIYITKEQIQQVAIFNPQQTEQDTATTTDHALSVLVTVGNENIVSFWNPWTLQRTARVWCHSIPSAYGIATTTTNATDTATALAGGQNHGLVAVSGVGTTIAILQGTQPLCTLSL